MAAPQPSRTWTRKILRSSRRTRAYGAAGQRAYVFSSAPVRTTVAELTRAHWQKKLKRLRRRRASADPEEESARPTRDGLAGIFDDDEDDVDAAYQRGAFPFGADEMAGFIEEDDDEDEEGIEDLDEEEREARRTLRRKERAREDKRNRMLGSKGGKRTGGGSGGGVFGTGAMAGIDNETWQEVIDVFGRGDEYEWAMDADDEKQTKKKELQDVRLFSPFFLPHCCFLVLRRTCTTDL